MTKSLCCSYPDGFGAARYDSSAHRTELFVFSIIISKLWDIISWLFGWKSSLPEGSAVGIKLVDGVPVYVEDSLPADGMLAYVLKEEDDSIYVPQGVEEEAAAALEATVEGDTWSFREEDRVVRRRRKVPPPGTPMHSTVAHVKWVYWGNFKCTKVSAGKILLLFKRVRPGWDGKVRYKMVSKYRVTEEGDYCLRFRYFTCKFGFVEVTGKFKEKSRSGRWTWKTRTRMVAKCAT